MKPPRLTIRTMLVVIAFMAVSLGLGRWAYFRYASPGITRTYYVGDLMGVTAEVLRSPGGIPAQLKAKLPEEALVLKSTITPDVWWFDTRSVKPFPAAMSLVVIDTPEGHQQVASWMKQRRDRLYSFQPVPVAADK
jgi:hypothetical protein